MVFDITDTEKGPNNWRLVPIEEIGEVVGGGTPSTRKVEYYRGDIAWITPKDLSGYRKKRISKGDRNITKEGLNKSSAKLMPKNTVLLSSRAPIGYVAIADNELSTNQGFKSIICDEKKVIPDYLYYVLKTSKNALEAISSGSTFKEVSGKAVKDFKIPLPPIVEQLKISNILSALDNKIELNNEMSSYLEQLAQTLFKRWFVDFEFPDENGEPYKSSGGAMVESELGLTPNKWIVGTLDDVAIIGSGKRPKLKSDKRSYEASIPIIGASKIMGYTNEKLFNKPIVVTGRVGTHGVIQRHDYPCWPSDNTLVIESDYLEYVYQFLHTVNFKSLNRGSTQPLITQGDIKSLKLSLAPKEELEKFEKEQATFAKMISNKKVENNKLEVLRDTLLPKLLSGEIEIPDETEVTENVPIS